MAVELRQNGAYERVDGDRIADWLGGAGHDPEAIKKQYSEAYAVLTEHPIPYRYEINEQLKFIAALKAYDSATRYNRGVISVARKKFGQQDASFPGNDLDVWKGSVAPADLAVYSAIQSVLRNGDAVLHVLSVLDGLIAASETPRTPQTWHSLFLQVLAEHGIDPNSGSVDRTLTPEQFLNDYVALGKLPLDPGADAGFFMSAAAVEGGYKHGALTHILQWMIVASAVMAGQLKGLPWPAASDATRLGDVLKKTANPRGAKPHLSPWTTLVDFNPDRGIRYDATVPEGLTYWVYRCFPAISALEDQCQAELLGQLRKQGKTAYDWRPPAS